ncbi:MAG: sigma-70 family RNA polymerase sigma factor [Planctomycetota bacterium]
MGALPDSDRVRPEAVRPPAAVEGSCEDGEGSAARIDLEALLARVAQGDEVALKCVYDASVDRVFGLSSRILGDGALAEDAVAETYSQVWREASRYDPTRSSVLAWIVMMARTRAIDLRRGRGLDEDRLRRMETAAEPGDELDESAASAASRVERSHVVRRAVALLPREQRVALEAAFLDGWTHLQVAERLRVPLGTVKSRIRAGLETLRRKLAELGETV